MAAVTVLHTIQERIPITQQKSGKSVSGHYDIHGVRQRLYSTKKEESIC